MEFNSLSPPRVLGNGERGCLSSTLHCELPKIQHKTKEGKVWKIVPRTCASVSMLRKTRRVSPTEWENFQLQVSNISKIKAAS